MPIDNFTRFFPLCFLAGGLIAILPAARGGVVMANPLVAHWSFEEGPVDTQATGPILDSSGNGHDGVAAGGPVYRESSNGPAGLALDFNGVDHQVFISDDPAFAFEDEFTVAVWINARSLPVAEGVRAPIIARGDARPGMNAWSLALEDSNIVFSVEDAAGNRAELTRPFRAVGNWVQYVRTYRTRAGQSFLHFRAKDSVATDVRPTEALDPAMQPGIHIGGIDGEFFDGLIDEVRIYNRALFRNNNGGLSLLGDTNDDGAVDIDDLNNLRNTFGGDCVGDANFDGVCDIEDLNAIRNEFGESLESPTIIPEPGTLPLATLAVLCLGIVLLRELRMHCPPRDFNFVWPRPSGLAMEYLENRSLLSISQPILNFAGPVSNGVSPPDPTGDVGIDYYIQAVNAPGGAEFTVYDKTDGSVVSGPTMMDTLASTEFTYEEEDTYCSNGRGDPIVLFDHLADRWLLSELGEDPSTGFNDMCVYISQTADPTGSWHSYAFDTPPSFDYPKFAVWPDAYYVGSNEGGQLGIYALDRTNMLLGNSPRPTQEFAAYRLGSEFLSWHTQVLMPSELDGDIPPPTGSPMYFYRQIDDEIHFDPNAEPPIIDPASDIINVWELSIDWNDSNNSTFVELDLEINTPNPKRRIAEIDSNFCPIDTTHCISQPQTGEEETVHEFLDALRTVPMWRLQYRNFGTHESLVGNFATGVNETSQAAVRWFEMRKTSTSEWELYQEGTIAPDATNRWLGSIAMDGADNIALVYNVSSAEDTQTGAEDVFPGIRYTGRHIGDALGSVPFNEVSMIEGAASLSKQELNRWGDYASLVVDPVDDATFWYTGEYVGSGGLWATRIGTFTFLPAVTGVTIGSSSGTHGDYEIPDGSGEQLRTVPVGAADQVMITFSEEVDVDKTDLTLYGAYSDTTYNVSTSTFSYDDETFTATWTFASAFSADQMVLTLDDAIVDTAVTPNALDGDWNNPTALSQGTSDAFPSGNGVAGGDFVFHFTILPGDADRDNVVDIDDLNIVNNNFSTSTTLWTLGEMTGDGYVDIDDKNLVQNNFGLDFTEHGGQEMAMGGGGGQLSKAERYDGFVSALAQLYATYSKKNDADKNGSHDAFWATIAEDQNLWEDVQAAIGEN